MARLMDKVSVIEALRLQYDVTDDETEILDNIDIHVTQAIGEYLGNEDVLSFSATDGKVISLIAAKDILRARMARIAKEDYPVENQEGAIDKSRRIGSIESLLNSIENQIEQTKSMSFRVHVSKMTRFNPIVGLSLPQANVALPVSPYILTATYDEDTGVLSLEWDANPVNSFRRALVYADTTDFYNKYTGNKVISGTRPRAYIFDPKQTAVEIKDLFFNDSVIVRVAVEDSNGNTAISTAVEVDPS